MDPLVQVSAVRKSFGSTRAVDGIGFAVQRGEMFGLIGPDGAGKTTTLRMILGLLSPDAGEIRTCGLNPGRQRAALSEKVGYLPQRFSLYGDLSVDENIAFFSAIHGVKEWRPLRDGLLKSLRLMEFRGRLAERLSGGMKQKLALACTLIHTPELLVLDEPTTGVDPVSRREFWRILAGLQREGRTILLTTPYLDEAERLSRVAFLNRGRILNLDTPQNLRKLAAGSVLEILARPKRKAAEILALHVSVTDVETFGERLHASVPSVSPENSGALRKEIQRALGDGGVQVESIRAVHPGLEDVFISRIRSGDAPAGEVNA